MSSQHLLVTVLKLIDEEVGEAAADAGVDGAVGLHEVAHRGEQVVEVAGTARLQEILIELVDEEMAALRSKGSGAGECDESGHCIRGE